MAPKKKPLKGGRGSVASGTKEAKEKRLMQGREIVTRYGNGSMGPYSKVQVKRPKQSKNKRGK